jgi:uncharacterized protein with HEPN domain
MVHDYLGIDINRIWDIVSNDIPILKSAIESLLADLE